MTRHTLPTLPSSDHQTKPLRTVIRSARFTPGEWEAVQRRAADVGLSPGRLLRLAVLGTPLGHRLNSEAVHALNRLGVNLNNLIRLALRSSLPTVAEQTEALLEKLRERLNNL